MIYFKACQRCGGDMHLSGDYYGDYRQCLQCGYLEDEKDARLNVKAPRKALETLESQAAQKRAPAVFGPLGCSIREEALTL